MNSVVKSASWGPAVAIGVLVASLAVLPRASALAQNTQQFVLEFEMAASKATSAEFFLDRGAGFDPRTSSIVLIAASVDPRPYSVPLPVGLYRGVRLDPFADEGDFVLEHARVRDRYGRVVADVALSRVDLSPFVAAKERTPGRLVASALPGHVDPQLHYRFETPLLLWLSRRDWAWFLLEGVLVMILSTAAALLLQQADKPIRPFAEWALPRRPYRTLAVTSLVSTLAAMYPLFLGHSLVTPNDGPVTLFYTTAPYTASSTDTQIEDARSADVRATMWVTLPYAAVQRAALADGEMPWWNRYSATGVPLLGQGQSAFFDPLQWLLLFGDLAFGADLKFIVARLVFVLGAGAAALLATECLGAALLVAIAAPFISHFIGRLNDAIHFSIVYAPWMLVSYGVLLRDGGKWRAWAGAAGLLASTALVMFSSSPKEAFVLIPTLHLAGMSAVALQAWRVSAWRGAIGKLQLVLVATIGAALITAPHWLTFLETLSNAFTAYDLASVDFAGPSHAIALVAGVFFPGIVYPGLNPVLAVLAAMGLVGVRQWLARPLVAGCVVAAVLMIALAFGAVPGSWLRQLPLVAKIGHVGSTFITAALPLLLIVAAAGATQLGQLIGDHAPRRGAIPVSVLVGVALTGGFLFRADLADPGIGLALTACVWTGALCFLLLAIATPGRITSVIVAVTMAGLLLPGGLHLHTRVRALDALLMQPRERAALTDMPPALAPAREARGSPGRIAGLHGVMPGGAPAYLGLEGITGGDALFSPQTFWLGLQFSLAPESFPLTFRPSDPQSAALAPLFDLWGVRWLAAPVINGASNERLQLIERASAWPRAFFVDRTEVHADRRWFVNRLRSDSRPFASIRADDSVTHIPRALQGSASAFVEGRDYRLTANTTAFTIAAPTAGIVVLNEGFWPGVIARVGDQDATVFRANETMRAVLVPPGTWRITFSYRPATWTIASGLAMAGFATLLALIWKGATERRASPR